METEQLGWLIFLTATAVVLILIIHGMITGQYDLLDRLIEKMVYK